MSRNRVVYRLTGGQNIQDSPDAIEDGQLQLAVNTRVDEAGNVSSSPGDYFRDTGAPYYSTATQPYHGVFGLVEGVYNGSRYIWFKSNGKWYRYPYYVSTSLAGTESLLGTFTESTYRLGGFIYQDRLYLSDGYTFRRSIDGGTTLKRVGVQTPGGSTTASPPPGIITSITETQAGSSTAGAINKWAVTYYNDFAESNLSPVTAHTWSASTKKARMVIPVDTQANTSTTKRRLYRTDNGGEYLFYITQINDNTTTSVIDPMGIPPHAADPEAAVGDDVTSEPRKKNRDTYHGSWFGDRYGVRRWTDKTSGRYTEEDKGRGDVIQTNLGLLADWTDHDQPGTGAAGTLRSLIVVQEVTYGIRGNDTLAFSAVGNPEYWSPFEEVPIGKGTGETLLQILDLDGDIICYTDQGIYSFTRLGVDATNSTLKHVSTSVKAASSNSVCKLGDGTHVIFAKDGIWMFDGRRVEKISQEIDKLWTDSTLTSYYVDPSKVSSVACVAKDKEAWFSYRLLANTANNGATIHLNLEFGSPRFTVDTYAGYNCFMLASDGNIWAGRDNSVSIINSRTTTTQAVNWLVKTKQFDLGDALQGKRPVAIEIDADLMGADTTLTVYGDNDTTIATFSLTGHTGRKKIRRLLPIKGSYNRLSVQLQSLDFDVRRWYSVAFEAEESDITE